MARPLPVVSVRGTQCRRRGEGLVGLHHTRLQHLGQHQFVQRLQKFGGRGHPVGERRARQFDALAGQHRFLTVERQVIAVLRGDDVGEEARAGQTLVDRLSRLRRHYDV